MLFGRLLRERPDPQLSGRGLDDESAPYFEAQLRQPFTGKPKIWPCLLLQPDFGNV